MKRRCHGVGRFWLVVGLGFFTIAGLTSGAEPSVGFQKSFINAPGAGGKKLQVYSWYPTEAVATFHTYPGHMGQRGWVTEHAPLAKGRHPLIVFSHGFAGSGDQSIFLMEALARAGYIVAAPDHPDARLGFLLARNSPDFTSPKTWTDQKYLERNQEMVALLDFLLGKESWWAGQIDASRVGAMGHSLGGYTVLGMAGAWPSWKDPRVKAVVGLSPFSTPFLDDDAALGKVTIPVMIQGGTLDWGITPTLPEVFEGLGGPASYLVLKGENHLGWTNLATINRDMVAASKDGNTSLMIRHAVAFFNQNLRRDGTAAAILRDKAGLESLEFRN
jgi:predicted dienelactone hydrolase